MSAFPFPREADRTIAGALTLASQGSSQRMSLMGASATSRVASALVRLTMDYYSHCAPETNASRKTRVLLSHPAAAAA